MKRKATLAPLQTQLRRLRQAHERTEAEIVRLRVVLHKLLTRSDDQREEIISLEIQHAAAVGGAA